MVAGVPSLPRAWRRERLGGRAIALIAIILIHLGLLLALLFAKTVVKRTAPPTTVVRLIALPRAAPAPKPKTTPKAVTHPNTVRVPTPIVKVPPPKDTPAPLFKTEMFDAVDISKLPSHKGEQTAEGSGGTGSGSESGYGPGVGTGRHGETLYAAQWYREPTDAEIQPYLPRNLPDEAMAEIECRTIANFGVEDCQELGESPVGTGLSRAIRQAGWQFKVRPVRLGSKFEVGTWVRITYTITTTHRAP